jgi:hypothetical protein
LMVFNILGQVLAVKKLENTVDVGNPDAFGKGVVSLNENLEAGIYLLCIEAQGKVSRTIRVVKH